MNHHQLPSIAYQMPPPQAVYPQVQLPQAIPQPVAPQAFYNGTTQPTNQMLPSLQSSEATRKDKRRQNMETKMNKIASAFAADKDIHYRERLTALQSNLTTLHQGTNSEFLRSKQDLEELRDMELIGLRLYEEYRVHRTSIEFGEDIEKTKSEHESMVKLVKEKLYDSLERKIKNLKEERLLLDVANSHSYSIDYSRGQFQKHTRSTTQSVFDYDSGNDTATGTGYYSERRKRRGKGEESQASGDETANKKRNVEESDADINEDLHALIFGNGSDSNASGKKTTRNNNRYNTKAPPPLPSLKVEEVNEDIALIRSMS